MRVRCRYESRVAKALGVQAITLYPFVLFADDRAKASRTRALHHEFVHVRQVRDVGWFTFYVSYAAKFLYALTRVRSFAKAYEAVSYERQAYAAEATIELTPDEVSETL